MPRLSRAAALLLTVATGFTGLVYEVSWQTYLAILLGSHSEATAAVLGVFLAGLAAGYALFGLVSRRLLAGAAAAGRPARLLWLYAAIEAGIGVYALLFPWLFRAAQAASLAAPAGSGGAGFALDVLLTAALIGPPTVLMGGTIPILTQALARDLDEATRVHAWVYAFNTGGAFAGALAAGFVLIPALGLPATLAWMSLGNLAAAAAFAWMEGGARIPAPPAEPAATARIPGAVAYASVALLNGFAMMALQTVVIRLGGLSFGASPFTFAMVVAVFVLCIAIGSLLVSFLRRLGPALLLANQAALALLVIALHHFADEAPYWVHVLRTHFGRSDAEFTSFHAAAFLHLLLVLGPAVALSGAALPLLFHHARGAARELGATAGRLYAWNTCGSLLGALLGGYALLFWLDLDGVYRVAAAALVAGAAVLGVALGRPALRPLVAAAGAACLAGLLWLAPWRPELLSSGLFRHRVPVPGFEQGPQEAALHARHRARLVFQEDDPTATVSVREWRSRERLVRGILTNGKSDGSTQGDYPTMALAGLVPALLADQVGRAFVIGWGTGVTAGELAALPSMREVVVAEISPAVLRAAPLFDFANQAASRSPKLRLIRSDAYRALLREPGGFDVIVSEPSNPWMTGVEMLFSLEFLEAARARLAPGGVYVQWYHQYETDLASIALVLRTYAAVFPQVAVWYGGASDLLLLGFERADAQPDLARIESRARRPAYRRGLERSGITSLAGLLAHEVWPVGVLHALSLAGPVHTLEHPRLSHQAARAFFRGRPAQLPFSGSEGPARIGAQRSLLGRHLAEAEPAERARRRAQAAFEACGARPPLCGALLADWFRADPGAPELAELAARSAEAGRGLGGGLELAWLPELAALAGAPEADSGALPFPRAQLRLALFARFYHHALPFAGERLLDGWRRCESPHGLAPCRDGLERARRLLAGDFRAP
jgi:spermidine synthase